VPLQKLTFGEIPIFLRMAAEPDGCGWVAGGAGAGGGRYLLRLRNH
jgi:hypothetical protein